MVIIKLYYKFPHEKPKEVVVDVNAANVFDVKSSVKRKILDIVSSYIRATQVTTVKIPDLDELLVDLRRDTVINFTDNFKITISYDEVM